jgi:3-oxoadipate enol-lactonase / 4-carboxymuconolactone decarboxylase
MEARRTQVLEGGMPAIADVVMARFFSAQLRAENTPAVASARRVLHTTDPIGYAGCCAAIRDMNQTALLAQIRVPCLIIGSGRDPSLPWAGHSDVLARDIVGARALHRETAHLSNLEAPREFSAALFEFLLPVQTDPKKAGLRVRRAALGTDHVERAMASADAFSADFQDLLTRYAWGEIWSRPGLDLRTRRLLVLVIAASLARWEEFRLHVRTGLARELEACDLKEALLQTAVYAGVPAANTAFHIAAEELSARRHMTSNDGERQ